MDWVAVKQWIADTPLEKDLLHVYAAVTIQMVAAYILRRPLSSIIPWLAVLLIELINEMLDISLGETASIEPWQVGGAIHDLINTMLLPTVLLVLVRWAPALFESHVRPRR